MGKRSLLAGLRYTINAVAKSSAVILQEVLVAIKKPGVEALLVDQVSLEGGTVADILNLPFIRVISSGVGVKLAERMSSPQLSTRELEVIRLIVAGKNNHEISTLLHISESTVKFHVNNILSKLGVNDRTQAAIAALERGIASVG